MLDLSQIESFYPESLRPFKKNLLREYLQYKVLEAIFDSKLGDKLVFMGGTACRIIHQNTRFSEDLDFDNLGINRKEFALLIALISKRLTLEGYESEAKNVFKGAYKCYLRFPGLLFKAGLSRHHDEKLMIQIDTKPQNFTYKPEKIILNKFDVFLRINVVPVDILLAQNILAIFKRERPMGRDFYDVVFLLGKTVQETLEPDFGYLKDKVNISNMAELKTKLLAHCKNMDFKQLAKDVQPFLFHPENSKKVLLFRDYLKSLVSH